MRRTERGVTLLELIIVITVLAIAAATVLPGLQGLFENTARRTDMRAMISLFNLARTEAVSQGTIVTICPLDADDECTGNWQRPIHVFADPGNQRALADTAQLLRVQEPPDSGSWTVRVGNRGYFQYRPNGTVHGTLGNLTWCPESGNRKNAGQLIINMGGRLRFAQDHSGDGLVQGSNGQPVNCP